MEGREWSVFRVRKSVTECIQAELGLSDGTISFLGAFDRDRPQQRRGILEVSNDGSEDLAVGIGFRHGDPDVADREADLGADLQELQANRLTLSASQLCFSPRRRKACMSM